MWKLPQPRKSSKVAFGAILLDDFLRYLENPAGFTTVTTSAAATINFKTINKRVCPFCSIGVGSFYVVKSKRLRSWAFRLCFLGGLTDFCKLSREA